MDMFNNFSFFNYSFRFFSKSHKQILHHLSVSKIEVCQQSNIIFSSQLRQIHDISSWKLTIQSGEARGYPGVSDWPQMGQMWDFLRSDLSSFWSREQKLLNYDLKKSRICPILVGNLTYCGLKSPTPVLDSANLDHERKDQICEAAFLGLS